MKPKKTCIFLSIVKSQNIRFYKNDFCGEENAKIVFIEREKSKNKKREASKS
jgi:hypothetical protein